MPCLSLIVCKVFASNMLTYQNLTPERNVSKKLCPLITAAFLLMAIVSGIIVHLVFSRSTNPRSSTKENVSKILIIGGFGPNAKFSMELYHPFNPQLNHVINVTMRHGRRFHTSSLMDDGTVITVGGWNAGYLSSCERFNPSSFTVTQCPSLKTKRGYLASAVLNGVLYVFGGWDDSYTFQSCERLLSNGWQDSVSMNNRRDELSMVSLNGYLYAIGGYDGSISMSSVERLSVTDDQWTDVQSMNDKRRGHSSTVMDGKIFVCGGYDITNRLSSCEQYNPTYDQWSEIAQMHLTRSYFQMIYDGKKLFAVGGGYNDEEDDYLRHHRNYRTVEMYDTNNNTWIIMRTKLIHKRWKH